MATTNPRAAQDVSRRDFLLLCAAASGAPLASLDPRSAFAADAPKRGGTLRVGFYIEAATMDPHFSGSKIDRQVYHNIYEPLVTLDVKLGIKPGLAESWQQPDPKTVVFKLRRGVKFHDGTDFNAEAARFNFNRMKTEPKSVRKGEVASIDSVDAVDAYTIKINLKRPDAALLATLTDRAGMMVSPKVAQERGSELERNAKGAGTGPFEFVEWVKDDHLLIKRNESYWNKQGGPYLDRVRYRPIPDDTVKLQSLQTGEIDVMDYVQPRDVAAVKADRNVVVVDVPSLADFAYQLNHTRPPFATKALRQAVASSLDLEQIVKGVWLNVGVPANGPIPPTSWAYDRSIAPIKRDLGRAKAKQQQELRDDQLSVERPPGPGRQHVPVLQDHAGHVAQLVGHLESADRCLARPEPRGVEPGRAQEAVQRPDEDSSRRAADGVHRAPDRAEGLQPEGAGLRADPRRDDAIQGRVAGLSSRPPTSA